ncbi:hypothetical protein PMI38_00372, partial [Pseudomonas sp. GM84]
MCSPFFYYAMTSGGNDLTRSSSA